MNIPVASSLPYTFYLYCIIKIRSHCLNEAKKKTTLKTSTVFCILFILHNFTSHLYKGRPYIMRKKTAINDAPLTVQGTICDTFVNCGSYPRDLANYSRKTHHIGSIGYKYKYLKWGQSSIGVRNTRRKLLRELIEMIFSCGGSIS